MAQDSDNSNDDEISDEKKFGHRNSCNSTQKQRKKQSTLVWYFDREQSPSFEDNTDYYSNALKSARRSLSARRKHLTATTLKRNASKFSVLKNPILFDQTHTQESPKQQGFETAHVSHNKLSKLEML